MSDPGLTTATTGGNKSNVQLIYILYLVGLAVPFLPIVALIMSYVSKKESPEWLMSHYVFQIRTFWIGLLYIFIGAVLSIVLIGFLILLATLIWYIVRMVQGLDKLGRDQAIPDPRTWTLVT